MENKKLFTTVATGIALIGVAGNTTVQADEIKPVETTEAVAPETVENKEVTEAQVATAQVSYNQAEKEVASQQSVVEDAKQVVAEKTTVTENAKATYDEAESKAKEATPENVAKAEKTIADTAKEVETKETAIKTAKGEVTKAENEVAGQKPNVAKAQEKVGEAQADVKTAQADVDTAQKTLDGTGAKEVVAKAEATKAKQDNDQKKVDEAKVNLDNAKKADATRQKAIDKATKEATIKEAEVKKAVTALDDANYKMQKAGEVLATKTGEYTDAKNDYDSLINFTVPTKYVEALKKYADYNASEAEREKAENDLKAMNAEMSSLNQFKSNPKDNGVVMTIGEFTNEQKDELTFFANDILNQIRKAFGTKETVITKGAKTFANDVAQGYTKDNWGWDSVTSKGHDVPAIIDASKKHGLYEGQYYENLFTLYGGRKTLTMNRAKELVFDAFQNYLFNGDEWLHAKSVSGVDNEDNENQYMGVEISSQNKATSVHLLTVPEGHIKSGSTFDKTIERNPKTKEQIVSRYNTTKGAYETAKADYTTAQSVVETEKANKATAELDFTKATNELAIKQAIKEQTPEAQAKLDKAQEELVESIAENKKAQEAVENLNADILVKKSVLENAKKVLAEKTQKLTTKQAELKAEQDKLAELEGVLATAKANLEKAESELVATNQKLVEAKAHYQALVDAPVKLDEAKKAYEKAQKELDEAQKVVEVAQAKLQELVAIRDEKKATFESLKTQYEAQEEAKRQVELERKRVEIAKQGLASVPVFSQEGKIIDLVPEVKATPVALSVGEKFVDEMVDTSYQAPTTLPQTGTQGNAFALVGFSLIAMLGLGFKKKEGN